MNLQPIGDRVVVEVLNAEERTSGGIFLPDAAKEKPQRGVILAVGPGKMNPKTGVRTPLQLKAGDKVLFTSWAGDEYKDKKSKDGEVLVMHEEDVMAVIE